MPTATSMLSNSNASVDIDPVLITLSNSIIWLNREFVPFLPTKESSYRGPLDTPVFQEQAPDGWWERSAEEHFFAVDCISSMMRAMRQLDPNHYTPFSGLCIFTAAMMNIYEVKFPAMSRSRREDPKVTLAENVDDLHRFSEMWKIGRGLLDVVGVVRKLYDRVVHHEARLATHSRDSYVTLEKTINLAQDHEIQVSELAAEASVDACRDDLREVGNISQAPTTNDQQRPNGTPTVLEGDFAHIPDMPLLSPGALSAALDEDVWREFVFFRDT